MVQSKRQKYLFLTFCLLPTFIVFLVFTIYPMISGLYMSFFDWSGTSANRVFIGLGNYKQLLEDSTIFKALWHDYFFVFAKVIGIMTLAIFFAVALTQLRMKRSTLL